MKKIITHKIQEIDDSVKSELRTIYYSNANIIEKDYWLIMDNSEIVKYTVSDTPFHSPEPRILLVKKGSIDYTLNHVDYHIVADELLMVPANFTISIIGYSHNFNARILSFCFPDMDYADSVGYDVVKLRLGHGEKHVFDNFFQMMNFVLKTPTTDKQDFKHLVLSMLFRIKCLNTAQNGLPSPLYVDRKQAIFSQFMRLVNTTESTHQTVSYYADKIGVSANYLSVVIKEKSGRTVMDWVAMRTVAQIKKLLLDPSHLTVNQIAERLSFSSSTQMIRVFKKGAGMTPLEYQRKKKQRRF